MLVRLLIRFMTQRLRLGNGRGTGVLLSVGLAFLLASSAGAEVVKLSSKQYAGLVGYVYADVNKSRQWESGEGVIPNITVSLEGIVAATGATISLTTTTDDHGGYHFVDLQPGTYSVTETQPIEFLQGLTELFVGTAGGSQTSSDRYVGITLTAGKIATGYNFSEAGLRSAYISKRYLLTRGNDVETDIPEDPEQPTEEVPEPVAAIILAMGFLAFFVSRGRSRNRS